MHRECDATRALTTPGVRYFSFFLFQLPGFIISFGNEQTIAVVEHVCALYNNYFFLRPTIEYCMLKGTPYHHFSIPSFVSCDRVATVIPLVFASTHHIPTVYNWMGIKCRSGRVVMNSMKSMRSITFGEKKKTFLDTVNEWVSPCLRLLTHRVICRFHVLHFFDHTTPCAWVFVRKTNSRNLNFHFRTPHIRVIFCYACRDNLIDKEISREYADCFQEQTRLVSREQNSRYQYGIFIQGACISRLYICWEMPLWI